MARSDREEIPAEWITALDRSLITFADLVLERRVVGAWAKPSILAGYTVGGIAGHVLSLLVGLQMRLDADTADLNVIPYQDWYRTGALSNTDVQLHTQLIQLGESLASGGPEQVRADLDETRRGLVRLLGAECRGRTVPLASVPGTGVALDDYLRTRFVEITVHADDIASSVGLRCPTFPEIAWTLSASVIVDATGVPGTGARYVMEAWRPERAATDEHT